MFRESGYLVTRFLSISVYIYFVAVIVASVEIVSSY
jgi:hypothetical protein